MAEENVTLNLRRVLVRPADPPKPANQFLFARVGADAVLEIGYFDLVELRDALLKAKDAGGGGEASLYVTDRFTLTPQGALSMYNTARQIVEDLRKEGVLPPDPKPGKAN